MRPIQSIICFNGGSAGDLVMALSLLAHNIESTNSITSQGAVIVPYYFKNFSIKIWNNHSSITDIDWDQVQLIENSHHYCVCYPDIAQNLFYIDYSNDLNSLILSEFVRKRYQGNWEDFFKLHNSSIPSTINNKILPSNYKRAFEIQWMKNLKSWRNDPSLNKIDFLDLLDHTKLIKVVESVANTKIKDFTKFNAVYAHWRGLNSNFLNC